MTEPLIIQRFDARVERWLREDRSRRKFETATAEVLAWVELPNRDPIGAAYPLDCLATWHAHTGVVATEASERWRELERSFYCQSLGLRLQIANWIGRSRPQNISIEGFLEAGMLAAWAIWWNNDAVASWLGHFLTDPEEDAFGMGEPPVPAEWFLGMLHDAPQESRLGWLDTEMLPHLGPYRPLVDYMFRGGAVPNDAFAALCEYHVEQALDEYHGVYRHTPWDLFPVELLAYQRRCEQYGLDPPRADHPIIHTPLCEPHELTEPPEDMRPLAAAVDEACAVLQGSAR